mgnify:CR=1 FL=1
MSGRHASRLAKLEARYRQAIQPDIDEAIRRELATMTPAEIAALEAEATTDTDRAIYRELARLAGARRTPNTQATREA